MPNVLIIEADAIVRNFIMRVLTLHGFRVLEATNPEEPLLLCRSFGDEPLDLLIADHETMRPEVSKQILAHSANTKVLHTAAAPLELLKQTHAIGPGNSFLTKPFTATQLLDSIQTLLDPRTH